MEIKTLIEKCDGNKNFEIVKAPGHNEYWLTMHCAGYSKPSKMYCGLNVNRQGGYLMLIEEPGAYKNESNKVVLIPEKDNPYDEYATSMVLLTSNYPQHLKVDLGYVPGPISKIVQEHMGELHPGHITKIKTAYVNAQNKDVYVAVVAFPIKSTRISLSELALDRFSEIME